LPTHTLERARSPGSRERSENEGFRSGSRQAARTGRGVAAEAYGVAKKVQHLKEEPKDFDDATLADKIRSQVFRHADVPTGFRACVMSRTCCTSPASGRRCTSSRRRSVQVAPGILDHRALADDELDAAAEHLLESVDIGVGRVGDRDLDRP